MRCSIALRWGGAALPLAATLLLLGCAAESAQERPFRSPTRDYPAPPVQTSDGEVVGADRMAPEDKLQQGPTQDGLAPGWSLDEGKPKYNPKDQVGGHTNHGVESGSSHDHDHDDVPDAGSNTVDVH